MSEITKKRINMWREDKTLRENAKNLELSVGYIAVFKHYHNLKCIKQNTRKEIKWNPNLDIKENAKINNIKYSSMAQIKRYRGLNCITHKASRINSVNKKRVVVFLRKEGFAYSEIGRLFGGLTRQRVEQMEKNN